MTETLERAIGRAAQQVADGRRGADCADELTTDNLRKRIPPPLLSEFDTLPADVVLASAKQSIWWR